MRLLLLLLWGCLSYHWTLADAETGLHTVEVQADGRLSSARDQYQEDLFILPPLDRHAVGYTLSLAMVSFPLPPDTMDNSNYTTLASVLMQGDLKLSLDVQYPQQRPVLSLYPSGQEKEPHRCRGKDRLNVYNERITAQLTYAHSTRLLSVLLYVGGSLSNKCSFRTDASSDYALSSAHSTLVVRPFHTVSKIGYISAVEYVPRVLSFLEIVQLYQNSFMNRPIVHAAHVRELMRLLQAEATVYPIIAHSVCPTAQGMSYRVRYDVSNVGAHRAEDMSLCSEPTTAGVCSRFIAPTTEHFGYHAFGSSAATDTQKPSPADRLIPGDTIADGVLTVITPYWYLGGQPTSEPEWTRALFGGLEDIDGTLIRLDGYEESLRSVHFMETLCSLSSSLRHVLSPDSDSVFDVVVLVSEFDRGILHSTDSVSREGFLAQFKRENTHLHLVTETVSNDCGKDSYSLCADIQFGGNRSRVSLKKPEPVDVVRALSRVMSSKFQVEGGGRQRRHPYVAHLSSSIILVHSRNRYGHNWFYHAYHSLAIPAGPGRHGSSPLVVGGKVLTMDEGRILHYGYELVSHMYVGGQDTLLVPRERLRGYWGNDRRTAQHSVSGSSDGAHGDADTSANFVVTLSQAVAAQPLAVGLDLVMLDRAHFSALGGLDTSIQWPFMSFIDYCLRISFKDVRTVDPAETRLSGTILEVLNVGVIGIAQHINDGKYDKPVQCFGMSVLPVYGDERTEITSNYEWFNLDRLQANEAHAMRLFTATHSRVHQVYSRLMRQLSYFNAHSAALSSGAASTPRPVSAVVNPVVDLVSIGDDRVESEARLAWIIHCGGSQGFEAATILQQLEKMLNVRTIVRGHRRCEHSDTISDMPMYFQDIFDASAYKSFISPYVTPNNSDHSACEGADKKNCSDIHSTSGLSKGGLDTESGEVALYARDYREIGRWIPDDASYIIGRYMYEADSIPNPWAYQCNLLDEIWVPSEWQRDTFSRSGVEDSRLQVMHETVDSNLYSPASVKPLRLPGSVLDGYSRDDPQRPFAFCSVFKMEPRKGWKELLRAYITEFMFDSAAANVVLVLRTYRHSRSFITEEDFSKKLIMGNITAWIESALGGLIRRLPHIKRPAIEVVSKHLSSKELAMFYRSCDAFVLPTHGEGWGLPTHEAMAMGLPVITTDWGGSTEFTKPIPDHDSSSEQVALLVESPGLVPATGDAWLQGNWADINEKDLQSKMRLLAKNRSYAEILGKRGQRHVLTHFNQEKVAYQYATRIKEIDQTIRQEKTSSLNRDNAPRIVEDSSVMHRSGIPPMIELPGKDSVDETAWSMSSMPRGAQVSISTGSDYSMMERYQICRLIGPRPNRRRFRHRNTTGNVCDIAIVTTWEPRHCGIATYSASLRTALRSVCPPDSRIDVIAARWRDQPNEEFDSDVVKGTIRDVDFHDLIRVGRLINERKYHIVLVQFEFGMLYGDALMCTLRGLHTPVVLVTQHTITRAMLEYQHSLAREMHFFADRSIVMTETMRYTMNAFHGISPNRVVVIPHGISSLVDYNRPNTSTSTSRDEKLFHDGSEHFLRIKYPNTTIIMSNGLLHPYKGIEYMIWAMSAVLRRHPNVVYIVYGKPHPSGGNHTLQYYDMLLNESSRVQPEGHIIFNNSYLSTQELMHVLSACDIYVNAYTEKQQAVSGTLSMALGTGSVSISTPYPHALELLRDGVGVFVPFENSNAIAKAIVELLDDPDSMVEMKRKSAILADQMSWRKVAMRYLNIAREVLSQQ